MASAAPAGGASCVGRLAEEVARLRAGIARLRRGRRQRRAAGLAVTGGGGRDGSEEMVLAEEEEVKAEAIFQPVVGVGVLPEPSPRDVPPRREVSAAAPPVPGRLGARRFLGSDRE